MYVSQRKNRDGKIYYSISYTTKDGKRTRLRKDQHPHFETADEALAWAKSQDAIKSARQAYIESKVAWRTKHYEFDALLKRYESWQRQQVIFLI